MNSQSVPDTQPDSAVFRNPGAHYRPILMWLWNGDIDLATMRAQVADMAAKGIGGFFIHPMPDSFRKKDFVEGIRQPYPGEAFFGWVRAAAEAAREHGLACWLYDEGGWPSGTVATTLARDRPDRAGCMLRVQLPGQPPPAAAAGEVAAIDGPAGTLRFHLVREGCHSDLMDPAVTDAFLKKVHEQYRKAVGPDFGGLVPGMFTDEAAVGGLMGGEALPWTPALPDEFRRRKGYDLRPWLPVLFGPKTLPPELCPSVEPDRVARVRFDFGDVWTALHAEAFYGRMQDWCRRHKLLLVGHVGGEDSLENHATRLFGHFFRVMRHLDVPGVDVIWRQLFPGQPRQHFSKLAASAAHLEGKRLALSETFAVYGAGLTFAQMKWVTDRQYGDGINLMAPMAVHYSSSRGRAFCTMSNLGWGNPIWPLFKGYADYVGRLSYLLRLGRPCAKVAVLYPAASLWADPASAPAVADAFHAATDRLQEAQIDFDYLDEDTLAAAPVRRGALRPADQAYRALVLPGVTMLPWTAADKVRQWIKQGGVVVALDAVPRLCAEAERQADFDVIMKQVQVADRARLARFLAGRMERDLVLGRADTGIRYHHRIMGSDHLYFIVNATEQAKVARVDVEGGGSTEIWDPDSGSVTPIACVAQNGRTRARLDLPPLGSVLLMIRKRKRVLPAMQLIPRKRRVLQAAWEMAPVVANRLVKGEPREERWQPGCEAWQAVELKPLAELGWGDFSGCMAYRCRFEVKATEAAKSLWLDLGDVKHAVSVRVNGKVAGVRLWPPFRVEVTGLVAAGWNDLRVEVTNTFANQVLKPDEIAHATAQGWDNPYYKRVQPFERESLESGLLGPVSLGW